jgi:tRNA (cmo5U34)-methyltransferase
MKDFSFDTIVDFDNHIQTSIPRYNDIHTIIDSILEYFIIDNINIYDLGCSTGSLLMRISDKYLDKSIRFIGVDKSTNLIPESTNRVKFVCQDILDINTKFDNADIIFSIFTLCFIPPKYKELLIRKIYNSLNKGGVLIITDKLLCENVKLQNIFTFLYYDFKKLNFSEQDILDKEKALRNIQFPFTEIEMVDIFKRVGFSCIESFWRYYNFIGWICIK